MSASSPEVDRLGSSQYILLTTYKKDGTAVPTPVWVSSAGSKLFVLTDADAGKIKRIRNRAHVVIAPCDARGSSQGAAVDASARVIDDPAQLADIVRRHGAKYGLAYKAMALFSKVFRRGSGNIGIELTIV
jgi:PPOX class probable F420-dependent enzyme